MGWTTAAQTYPRQEEAEKLEDRHRTVLTTIESKIRLVEDAYDDLEDPSSLYGQRLSRQCAELEREWTQHSGLAYPQRGPK